MSTIMTKKLRKSLGQRKSSNVKFNKGKLKFNAHEIKDVGQIT